jgi:tetratricopeptide (TPR) repeat protein
MGDMPRATDAASEALSRGIEHPDFLVLVAHRRLSEGAADQALELAGRARELAPRHIEALNIVGLCLTRLGRRPEAIKVFDTALRQAPANAGLHFSRGATFEQMSNIRRARDSYERAVSFDPRHTGALAALANLAFERGDPKAARGFAQRALAISPSDMVALLALAGADIEEGQFIAALNRLTPLLRSNAVSPLNRAIVQSLCADALDGLARYPEAFAAYAAAGNAMAALYLAPSAETALQRARRLTEYFRTATPAQWRAATDKSPAKTHVFLVGFPRSGTTLLEQVLGAHPDVVTMDERDCLVDTLDFILKPGAIEAFAALDSDALRPYREAYWKRVGEAGVAPSRPVFLDKMPLNSVNLCLISKLFPDAKILFALRDPRDVTLSCFRRRFGFTEHMAELFTLPGAAAYYDAVMTLCDLYRQTFALAIHDVRYESLVADFTVETQHVCDFLGIAPAASMADFARRAEAVDTPSARQVARGLYAKGAGQWRHYAIEMQSVMARLQPWIARFGYEQD